MSETNNQNTELKQAKESAEALAKVLEQIGSACQNINAKTSAIASDISGAFGRIAGAMKAAVKEMEEFNSITMGNARGEIYETTDALYQNKQAAEGAAEAQRRLNEEKSKSPAIAPAEGIAQSGATEPGKTATDAIGDVGKVADKTSDVFATISEGLTDVAGDTTGVISKIASLGAKVVELTGIFATASAGASAVGTAFSAGFAGISILIAVINMVTQAQKEANQKVADMRQEITDMPKENISAAGLVAEYEQLENKTSKSVEDTQRMLDIRAELVEQYGFSAMAIDEEGRLLAGNLEIMKEQLAINRLALLDKMEEDKPKSNEEFNDKIKERKKLIKQLKEEEDNLNAEKSEAEFLPPGISEGRQNEIQRIIDNLKEEIQEIDAQLEPIIRSTMRRIVMTAQSEGKTIPEELQGLIADILRESLATGLTLEEGEIKADEAIVKFLAIDAGVILENLSPGLQELKNGLIAALLTDEDIDVDTAQNFVNSILGDIIGEGDNAEVFEKFAEAKQQLLGGNDSDENLKQYDQARQEILDRFNREIEQANRDMALGVPGAKGRYDMLVKTKKGYLDTSAAVLKYTQTEKAAGKTIKDVASSLQSVSSSLKQTDKEYREVANAKAAVKAIRDYNNATIKTEKLTKDRARGIEYLAGQYGTEKDAIEGMLPSIEDDIWLKELMIQANLAVALTSAYSAKAMVMGMISSRVITEDEGEAIIKMLDKMIGKIEEYQAAMGAGGIDPADIKDIPRPKPPGGGGGGGGGTPKKSAVEREMELMEQKKALDQLTTQEEIDNLERILRKHAKTKEEKQEIIEKLYELRKQKAKEDLEYQKAMDQLTLREELAAIDAQIAGYKAGVQARRELEKERYALAKELQRQEYDLKVYYGQLTLAQQEQQLRLMINDYKKGTQARIDLEKELYDMQQQIRDNSISRIDSVADGVISALENRYAEQQRIETERLSESKENWQKWGDEQVDAIQKQIDALDEMTKEEDRAEEERKKRRQIASLEQQLLYENDLYNQKKLQEQLQNAQKDLDDWLKDKEREDLKAALQAQIDEINGRVEAEQEKLDEQLEANDKYYEELTKEQKLQAEAQKLIMSGSQNELLDLLKNFAPEYNLTGQSLGEQLVDGFTSKVADVEKWFQDFSGKMSAYQKQMAEVATQAANEFYQAHGTPGGLQPGAEATGAVAVSGPQITMIFNQPVESPTEIRREMERLAEQLANL